MDMQEPGQVASGSGSGSGNGGSHDEGACCVSSARASVSESSLFTERCVGSTTSTALPTEPHAQLEGEQNVRERAISDASHMEIPTIVVTPEPRAENDGSENVAGSSGMLLYLFIQIFD